MIAHSFLKENNLDMIEEEIKLNLIHLQRGLFNEIFHPINFILIKQNKKKHPGKLLLFKQMESEKDSESALAISSLQKRVSDHQRSN